MNENELSKVIIGACIEVHKELGPGLLESVYEHCLSYELLQQGFKISRQVPVPVIYKGEILELGYRLDIWVNDLVIVEVKSVDNLHDIHLAQMLTYLRLTKCKLGLLVNFNQLRVIDGIKRVVNRL